MNESQNQEPVAWQWLTTAHFRKRLPKDAENGAWNPLYASPPEQQEELQRLRALVRAQQITIEKLEAQQQEPVAWMWTHTRVGKVGVYFENPAQFYDLSKPSDYEWKPLYTSPPASKPLTDEEIKRMAAKWFLSMYWPLCNTFAREIEAAHGIKGDA